MNPLSNVTGPAAAPSAAPGTPAPTGSQAMGKEEFLRLLVTQLSNQDPLNPMDGQQFAAQLAQFSSVEQLVNIGQMIGGQAETQGLLAQSINSGVAAGLIGKDAEAATDTFELGIEGEAPLGFELAAPADEVVVTVRDASGRVVRTLEAKNQDAGAGSLAWDGETDAGVRAAPGTYTFTVEAADDGETPVGAIPLLQGRVDRVSFGADGIRLWLGGAALPMSAVRAVEGG